MTNKEAIEIAIKKIKTSDRPITNGDVIKAIFTDAKVNNTKYSYVVEVKLPYHSKYDTGLLFDKDWWNAPYKRGE